MFRVILATNPAKLSPTPRTSHVVTGSIFRDRSLAFHTFSNQEVSHPLLILPFWSSRAAALMPLTATTIAHLIWTAGAINLFLAGALRSFDYWIAIRSGTALQLFVICTNIYILEDCFVNFKLFLATESLHMISHELFRTTAFHAGDLYSFPIFDQTPYVRFGTCLAELVATSERKHLILWVIAVAD